MGTTTGSLTIVEQNKQYLSQAFDQHRDLITSLSEQDQIDFRDNLLELASNSYLLESVKAKEIISIALSVTKLGLNVNPAFKEVYIVPFNTKVGFSKIMLPQAIIPLPGIQEMAASKGFFIRLYEVYNLDGEVLAENEMKRHHQMMLDTSNENWMEQHFVGFDVVLQDLKGEIPTQTKFVEVKYLKSVTKTIKDQRFKAQTWRHKAVRRAFGDFNIPRNRNLEVFTKLEHINDEVLKEGETSIVTPTSLEQLGLNSIQDGNKLIVQGNTYGKTEHLKALGFKFTNKTWIKIQEQPLEAEVVPKNNITYTAKDLAIFLMKEGMSKEQVGNFVKEELSISSSDTDAINSVMQDTKLLSKMAQSYLANGVVAA